MQQGQVQTGAAESAGDADPHQAQPDREDQVLRGEVQVLRPVHQVVFSEPPRRETVGTLRSGLLFLFIALSPK